ncbi:MAG: hypothetical protein ACLQPD_05430 [Desulfomonilaceae bacterium]
MKVKCRLSIMVVVVSLSLVSTTVAQQSSVQTIPQAAPSAKAKAVSTPSAGRPTPILIQQNILTQKAAAIAAQLKEVQRCILNASQLQSLRDPEGNINIVPQNDLTNCTRRLQDLQRQQDSLNRKVAALAVDAQAAGLSAQRLARLAALQKEIQALTAIVSGAPSKKP